MECVLREGVLSDDSPEVLLVFPELLLRVDSPDFLRRGDPPVEILWVVSLPDSMELTLRDGDALDSAELLLRGDTLPDSAERLLRGDTFPDSVELLLRGDTLPDSADFLLSEDFFRREALSDFAMAVPSSSGAELLRVDALSDSPLAAPLSRGAELLRGNTFSDSSALSFFCCRLGPSKDAMSLLSELPC